MKKIYRRCLGLAVAAGMLAGSLYTGIPVQATEKTQEKTEDAVDTALVVADVDGAGLEDAPVVGLHEIP